MNPIYSSTQSNKRPKNKPNQRIERLVLRKLQNINEKLKMTQRNGKTFHTHGSKRQILLKCLYYPKQPAFFFMFKIIFGAPGWLSRLGG